MIVWAIKVIPIDIGFERLMKMEFVIRSVALISEFSLF